MDAAWAGILVSVLGTGITIGVVVWKSGKSSGTVEERIKGLDKKFDKLETKVDKHNCLVERLTRVEESTKSAHHRIDEVVVKG